MAIADTITSMQNHTSNAYTILNYATDLTGTNKNLANLKQCIFDSLINSMSDTLNPTWNNLPKITGTGSNITLNDTANAPMRIMLNATELTQAGTPTPDSPQDIHTISGSNKVVICGKNKLNLGNISGTNNNVTYSINNGQLVLNGACNSDRVTINLSTAQTLNGTFTFSTNYLKPTALKNGLGANLFLTTGSNGVKTETINDTATQLVIYGLTGITFNNQVIELQVENGSSYTGWEPYISQEADIDLGGKQLYNYFANALYNSSTTRVQTNDYISLPAGTYTISYSGANQVYAIYFDSNNTKVGETNWTTGALTFTYNTAYKYKFVFRKTGDAVINATEVLNVMLNEGSTALPYQEYIEPIQYCKIGNYEDKFIRNSGKNLLDTQYYEQGSIDGSTGQNLGNSKNARGSNYISVLPNTTYTFSTNVSVNDLRLSEYASDNSHIQRDSTSSSSSLTITTTSNTYYVRWSLNYDNSTNMTNSLLKSLNPMLNEGTTVLPYEPYGSNEWYIKENKDKVMLDTLTFETATSSTSGYVRFRTTDLASVIAKVSSSSEVLPMMSNCYIAGSGDSSYNRTQCISAVASGNIFIYDTDYAQETLANFMTHLTSIGAYLYYPLATPTYTKITGTLAEQLEYVYQLLKSYKGVTNISQVNDDLSFVLDVQAIEELI